MRRMTDYKRRVVIIYLGYLIWSFVVILMIVWVFKKTLVPLAVWLKGAGVHPFWGLILNIGAHCVLAGGLISAPFLFVKGWLRK